MIKIGPPPSAWSFASVICTLRHCRPAVIPSADESTLHSPCLEKAKALLEQMKTAAPPDEGARRMAFLGVIMVCERLCSSRALQSRERKEAGMTAIRQLAAMEGENFRRDARCRRLQPRGQPDAAPCSIHRAVA
eukprot:2763979-Prymnesium_polylepis.2